MAATAVVTYFHNSSFMVRIGKTLLIFDYWRGEDNRLPLETLLTEHDMAGMENILIFVSTSRPDHFDQVIYTFNFDKLPITYVVGDDLPIGNRGKRIKEGDTLNVGGVKVTAYASTDVSGISLYVTVGSINIFYAGDLNFWHWREESTLREVMEAERAFNKAVEPLEALPVDIAMFPVDPRQGGMYDAGANHFLMTVKPRVMFPMHFQDRNEIAVNYARHARNRYTEAIALTKPREQAEIVFDDTRLTVTVTAPAPFRMTAPKADVRLDPTPEEDPFSDTDLPVEI